MKNFICNKKNIINTYKTPIVSFGIILFTKIDDKIKYLMIRRKDSVGYIDFIRGKYILYYKNYIQNLVNVITNEEKQNLLNKDFNSLWTDMWGDSSTFQYRNEEKQAEIKLISLKEGIHTNYNFFNLEGCISESNTHWEENEWGFPKGRKNYQEKDLSCAIREFQEETGIYKSAIDIFTNLYPIEETFMGSNLKSYKHKYYLAYIKNPEIINLDNFQKSEVSKMEWKTYEECSSCIRENHTERKTILKNINTMIHNLQLIL
jgi:ADP-ribose pyrophosphatase YjhB (NUDIX family)